MAGGGLWASTTGSPHGDISQYGLAVADGAGTGLAEFLHWQELLQSVGPGNSEFTRWQRSNGNGIQSTHDACIKEERA